MAANIKRKISWRNFWICFSISLGQVAFGYPSSIIGTTLGQPAFLLYMGLVTPEGNVTPHATRYIGATSGVFQAGAFFGILIGSWVMDKWGRKVGVIYCSVLSIIGGVMLCAAQSIGMFIAFRFFAGAGSWGYLGLIPVYTTELSPAESRGLFVGMNGVMIAVGYSIASYMGLAFFFSENPSLQWRGPLGLALIWPIMMLIIIYFVPESPRWLLMKGRTEEAWQVISKLHYDPNDPDQEYSRGEFYQMQKQTELDRTLNPTWKQMFMKPSYRKRVILGTGFAFLGQSTAVLVVNNYGPTLYRALGFGTRDQLILQCGWVSCGIPSNLFGAWVMDRFGRRPLMLLGVAGCCIMICLEAAIVAEFAEAGTNKAALGIGVAALYLFIIIYSMGVDVAGFVFFSELFPNHIRAKGVAISIMVFSLTDLVYLQVAAEAFANIGWKFYLVFICIMAVGLVWGYLAIPETKGVTLEEMAAIFGDDDDIVVYMKDIHVDHQTNELVVDQQRNTTGPSGVVLERHDSKPDAIEIATR